MMNKIKRSIDTPITPPAMAPLWSPTKLLPSPVVLTVPSLVVDGAVVDTVK